MYKWEDLILRCHIFQQRFDGQSCNHLRSLSFIYLQSSGKYVDCKPKLFNLFMKFSLFKSVQWDFWRRIWQGVKSSRPLGHLRSCQQHLQHCYCKDWWLVRQHQTRHGFIHLLRLHTDYPIRFYGCVESHERALHGGSNLNGQDFYNLITLK